MQVGDQVPTKKLLKAISKQYESTTKELDGELMMEYLVPYKWFDFGNMFHFLADNQVLFPQLMMAVEGMAGQIPADQVYLYKNIVDQSPLSIAISARNTMVAQQIIDAIAKQVGGALEDANLKLLENNYTKLVELQNYYKEKEELHNVLKLDALLSTPMIYANYNDKNLPRRGTNIINVTLIDKTFPKDCEKKVVYEKSDFGIEQKISKENLFERENQQEVYEAQDNQMVIYKQVKSQELLSTNFLESVYKSRKNIQLNMVPYLRHLIHSEYELGRRFRIQRLLVNVLILLIQCANVNLMHVEAPADAGTDYQDALPFGRQNVTVFMYKLGLLILNAYIGMIFLRQNHKAGCWALGILDTPQIQMSFFFIVAYFMDNQIEITDGCMIAYFIANCYLLFIFMIELAAFHRQSNLYVSLLVEITWEMRYLLVIYWVSIILTAYMYYIIINDNQFFSIYDVVYTIQTTFGYLGPLQDYNDSTLIGGTVQAFWIMNIVLFPILFYNLFISNVMKIHQAAIMDDENRYLRLKLAFIIHYRKATNFNPQSMCTRMPVKRDGEENLQMMAMMAMMDPTGGMMSGMDAAGQMAIMSAGGHPGTAGAGAGGAEMMAMQSEVKKVVDKLEALQDSIERLERL